MKKEDILENAREHYKVAVDRWGDIREQWVDNVKFCDGEQWDEDTKKARKGRPMLTVNKVVGVIKQMIGDQRQNRLQIKLHAVDSNSDPEQADVIEGVIRHIENTSQAHTAYDMGFSHACTGNIGYWRVITDYADFDTFDQDVLIERVTNPLAIYLDPDAKKQDFSDGKFAFAYEDLTEDEFKEKYPDADPLSWDFDKEAFGDWFTAEKKIVVAEYWYKETEQKTFLLLNSGEVIDKAELGEQGYQQVQMAGAIVAERKADVDCVYWSKIAANQVLEGPQKWPGRYIPIIPCLGEEVWIGAERRLRCAFHHAKDPQRIYNWARSTEAETVALAPKQPYLVTDKQIEGYEGMWNSASQKPMPYLIYKPDGMAPPPMRLGGSLPDVGGNTLAVTSADDIKATTGLYDASLGAKGNEQSGRAIIARQREGDTATFVYHDNLKKAIEHTGRILVDLIPKIYDTERVIRILGPDDNEHMVEINKKIVDPLTGQVKIVNDVTTGKYDVVVDAGPSALTQRMEFAESVYQIMQVLPDEMRVRLAPKVIKALDWPDAKEIAEELTEMLNPQQDPQAEQMAAMQQQMAMEQQARDQRKEELDIQGKELVNAARVQDMADQASENDQRMAGIAQNVVIQTLRQLGAI